MKTILVSESVRIPEEAEITVDHKIVTVTGPRGTEHRSFPETQLEFELTDGGRTLVIRCWMASKRMRAMVGTAAGHIRNLVTGVTAGYELTTLAIFKHFPINVTISKDGQTAEIANVVNNRRRRIVKMMGNTRYYNNLDGRTRDERILRGTNLEHVTTSAARLEQSSKDDMKRDPVRFIDGIYRKKLSYSDKHYAPPPRQRLLTQ